MDPDKIRAITKWPTLETLTQLRGFVGLCAFYRRFLGGFSHYPAPFTDLIKKGAFIWMHQAQECFVKLKQLMTTCPVLALLVFTKPFELQCDACGGGIGAVIMQDHHPIAF